MSTQSNAGLEARRLIAGRLLLEGKSRAEVARLMNVSWTSVNRWDEALARGGLEALAAKRHPGRRSFLTQRQRKQVLKVLERGAQAAGFPNDLWDAARVAAVIQRTCGVKYHERHVLKLLKKWGWTRQKPQRYAREQDPQAVARWFQNWPRLKKGA